MNCQRYDVAFGGFLLNRSPYIVDTINTYNAPNLAVARLPRLTRSGSILSQSRFEEKLVTINGRMVAAGRTQQTLSDLADRLKANLLVGQRDLAVGYADGRIYLNAIVAGTIEIEWNEATWQEVPFNITFLCTDPLLADPEVSSFVDADTLDLVAGNEYSKDFTFDLTRGNAFSYPEYIITIPFSSYGTTRIWLINTSIEGQPRIDIPYVFSSFDVVRIDGEELTVTVDDVDVEYEGQFVPLDHRAGATNVIELHAISTSPPSLILQANWRARWF